MNWIKFLSIMAIFMLICLVAYIIYLQCKEYHEQSEPILQVLKELLIPVHPIFKKVRIYKGRKSYTINKERIYICLIDENGEYYPMNALIHVILHEVAHMLNTKDVGHTEAWQTIFDELLNKASEQGIYNFSIPMISNYCGVKSN